MAFAHNGGVRLFYETVGDVGAPTVLLLHGAGRQSIDSPPAYRAALADRGYRVVVFDQRDTGLSTGFPDFAADVTGVAADLAAERAPKLAYAAADLAADALAVLDAAGAKSAHLLARSLGGYAAQLVALDHPERVRSLTIVMAFSRGIGGDMPVERLHRLDADRFADAEAYARRQVDTARALGNPAYFDADAIHAAALHAFARGVPPGSIARHFAVGLAAADLRPRLARLRVPVAVVHGALDRIIALDLARETAAAIPDARLTILDDMAHEGPPQLWDRWIDLFAANAARAQTIAKT